MVAKKLPDGLIGVGIFLVDVYCLGVKDAFFGSLGAAEYPATLDRVLHGEREAMAPACAKKLIEGSVAYASDFGLTPHRDYRQAKHVLDNIDATECAETFEFGRDGKPYYVSGPNDSPSKSRALIDRLLRRCGAEGFDYTLGLGPDLE